MPLLSERLQSPSTRLGIAIALVAVAVCCILLPEHVGRVALYDLASRHSEALVEKSLVDTAAAFVSVSAVKAALGIVTGSTIGIGFELELGDLAQPAYDYVDFVWKVFLWATAILMFYKVLLDTGLLTLGIPIAGVGLLLCAGGLLRPEWRGRLFFWGRRLVVFGLLFTYIVPVALIGADWLGARYTRPLKAKQQVRMEDVRKELRQAQQDLINLKDSLSITQPAESMERVRVALMQVANTIGRLTKEGLNAFLYYVVVLMFELLVLPFLTAVLLYAVAKFALGRVGGAEGGVEGRSRSAPAWPTGSDQSVLAP
jgi:predicted PurR-regulated permease PerM